MLKPFYNKKKNIDNRLVPAVTAADAGKLVGVTDEGKFGLVEAGGGGVMVVEGIPDPSNSNRIIFPITGQEVLDTMEQGKIIIVKYSQGDTFIRTISYATLSPDNQISIAMSSSYGLEYFSYDGEGQLILESNPE